MPRIKIKKDICQCLSRLFVRIIFPIFLQWCIVQPTYNKRVCLSVVASNISAYPYIRCKKVTHWAGECAYIRWYWILPIFSNIKSIKSIIWNKALLPADKKFLDVEYQIKGIKQRLDDVKERIQNISNF